MLIEDFKKVLAECGECGGLDHDTIGYVEGNPQIPAEGKSPKPSLRYKKIVEEHDKESLKDHPDNLGGQVVPNRFKVKQAAEGTGYVDKREKNTADAGVGASGEVSSTSKPNIKMIEKDQTPNRQEKLVYPHHLSKSEENNERERLAYLKTGINAVLWQELTDRVGDVIKTAKALRKERHAKKVEGQSTPRRRRRKRRKKPTTRLDKIRDRQNTGLIDRLFDSFRRPYEEQQRSEMRPQHVNILGNILKQSLVDPEGGFTVSAEDHLSDQANPEVKRFLNQYRHLLQRKQNPDGSYTYRPKDHRSEKLIKNMYDKQNRGKTQDTEFNDLWEDRKDAVKIDEENKRKEEEERKRFEEELKDVPTDEEVAEEAKIDKEREEEAQQEGFGEFGVDPEDTDDDDEDLDFEDIPTDEEVSQRVKEEEIQEGLDEQSEEIKREKEEEDKFEEELRSVPEVKEEEELQFPGLPPEEQIIEEVNRRMDERDERSKARTPYDEGVDRTREEADTMRELEEADDVEEAVDLFSDDPMDDPDFEEEFTSEEFDEEQERINREKAREEFLSNVQTTPEEREQLKRDIDEGRVPQADLTMEDLESLFGTEEEDEQSRIQTEVPEISDIGIETELPDLQEGIDTEEVEIGDLPYMDPPSTPVEEPKMGEPVRPSPSQPSRFDEGFGELIEETEAPVEREETTPETEQLPDDESKEEKGEFPPVDREQVEPIEMNPDVGREEDLADIQELMDEVNRRTKELEEQSEQAVERGEGYLRDEPESQAGVIPEDIEEEEEEILGETTNLPPSPPTQQQENLERLRRLKEQGDIEAESEDEEIVFPQEEVDKIRERHQKQQQQQQQQQDVDRSDEYAAEFNPQYLSQVMQIPIEELAGEFNTTPDGQYAIIEIVEPDGSVNEIFYNPINSTFFDQSVSDQEVTLEDLTVLKNQQYKYDYPDPSADNPNITQQARKVNANRERMLDKIYGDIQALISKLNMIDDAKMSGSDKAGEFIQKTYEELGYNGGIHDAFAEFFKWEYALTVDKDIVSPFIEESDAPTRQYYRDSIEFIESNVPEDFIELAHKALNSVILMTQESDPYQQQQGDLGEMSYM
jgi:hypothetical protein